MAFAAPSGRSARNALAAACWRVAALSLLPTALSATVYQVGPGHAYDSIGAVPWESLAAGDSVVIHWRSEPYREKWVICRVGSPAAPIVVRGLPSPTGELPVVSGENATTRPQLNYWNRERGVVKIGGANVPPDCMPAHIIIEGDNDSAIALQKASTLMAQSARNSKLQMPCWPFNWPSCSGGAALSWLMPVLRKRS